MRRYFLFAILITVWFFYLPDAAAQTTVNEIRRLPNGNVVLEDFERYALETIPDHWYNQEGEARPALYEDELREPYRYRVLEGDSGKFLRYEGVDAKHLNFPLVNKGVDIFETPILSWRWRVLDLPAGANEDNDDLNDAAASIYVVFDLGRVLFRRVPKSIRYTWSSTLPAGTELSKFFGNQKVVVVESGTERLGDWYTFERNIVEDYRRLFGDDPPSNPLAILILSDGNSVADSAAADYDDIMLKKLPE